MLLAMASVVIPLVHFVTVPLAPFIGGFMAGTRSAATGDEAVGIGLLMGLFSVGLVFGIGALLNLFLDFGLTLIVIFSVVTLVYITGLACLGAIMGGNRTRRQTLESAPSS
jgi:hypothetical protein